MIDLVILVLAGLGLLSGLRSGLIRQVLGLAALIVAIVAGRMLALAVGNALAPIFGVSDPYVVWVGFLAIFVAVYIAAAIVGQIIMSLVKVLKLSAINRILGGAFGAAKMVLLLGVLALLLANFDLPPEDVRGRSSLYQPLVQSTHMVLGHVSRQLQTPFKPSDEESNTADDESREQGDNTSEEVQE